MYHGTNSIIDAIDLDKSRNRTDFGKGFYFADKIGTAQLWAVRKAELQLGTPTIIQYEFDNCMFDLNGRRFATVPDLDWLTFICNNRRRNNPTALTREPRHDYHWVSGLIADDKVVDVVDEYLNGEISDSETLRRLRALPATYQLSLHSQSAISLIDEASVKYKELKKGRWTQKWLKRRPLG
jgi:hypothetical protein